MKSILPLYCIDEFVGIECEDGNDSATERYCKLYE